MVLAGKRWTRQAWGSQSLLRLTALLLLSSAALPVFAADPPPAAPLPAAGDVRQKLELRKNELDATQARAKFIQSDLAEIKQEREKLNAKLLETAALIQ